MIDPACEISLGNRRRYVNNKAQLWNQTNSSITFNFSPFSWLKQRFSKKRKVYWPTFAALLLSFSCALHRGAAAELRNSLLQIFLLCLLYTFLIISTWLSSPRCARFEVPKRWTAMIKVGQWVTSRTLTQGVCTRWYVLDNQCTDFAFH